MSQGLIDPDCRATVEAVLAKWAAPGMCNPDDEAACVDGEPSKEAVQVDRRSQGQRNHDALKAMGRSVLASGELGKHNGLPATIIVSTTLQDLQSAAGVAVTAGGTLLPMREVIKQASQAHHYLVIYDKHTREPLYCGRAKRFATPGQRIVLHALDRGCTRPGCTAPGYWVRCTMSTAGPRMTAKPTSTSSPWPADPTTASSKRAAGLLENAKTAVRNGSHHHT